MNNQILYTRAVAITNSDTLLIPNPSDPESPNLGCAIFTGNGGDIKVQTSGRDIVTFINVSAGTFMPIKVIQVFSSGTDDFEITGLWP